MDNNYVWVNLTWHLLQPCSRFCLVALSLTAFRLFRASQLTAATSALAPPPPGVGSFDDNASKKSFIVLSPVINCVVYIIEHMVYIISCLVYIKSNIDI